jgi:hypothetical protein
MRQAISLEQKQKSKRNAFVQSDSFIFNKSLQPKDFNFKLLPFHPAPNCTSLYKLISFCCLPLTVYSVKTKKNESKGLRSLILTHIHAYSNPIPTHVPCLFYIHVEVSTTIEIPLPGPLLVCEPEINIFCSFFFDDQFILVKIIFT